MVADRDVINKGVKYEASNNKVVWNSANSRRETVNAVDQGQIMAKGDAVVTAGRDVTMQAGKVTSNKDVTLVAGRQVNMQSMIANHELEEHRYDKGKSGGGHSQTTETHDLVNEVTTVGSSVEGNNVTVAANADVALSGSEILAADKVQVEGKNVKLDTAAATSTVDHVYKDKKKSLVKRERTDATGVAQVTAVTGSVVSGKEVTIKSGHDVMGQSAKLMGEQGVQVSAAGKVELGADKNVTKEASTYRHKTSGLMGSGIGFTIGTEKRDVDDTNREEETVRNTIASTKGHVNITANDTVHLTSADVLSKTGTTIEGATVTLDGNTDTQHMTHDDRYKKSGLTVALGGALADSITNATRTIKQAGGRDDKRLAALELNEARKQLQDGYEAVDSALHGAKIRDAVTGKVEKVDGKAKRGPKNIDNAINLSVSVGSTSRKQGQVVDTKTYQGGTLISENNVHIIARDAEQNGIGLTGETVKAKKLVLDSARDIKLEAGKNTVDVNNSYKSSGWSVGAGISLTGGGLLDINASAHMARQNGDTHQESYVPTKIKAVELAQLKAKRDTNIIGSTVSGKKVDVDTGRDLHIQSLQDVDNFKEHSKSAGLSVSFKPTFKDPTGSINASVGRIDSKWKSVTEQAGIYAGEEGYDKIYNNIGLVPNLGIGSKGKASSTTQSAISDGILTVDGKEIDTKTINTNTENTLHQLDKIFDKKKIEERQELARLFSKNAFEQLHNWQPTTKDGKIAKSIAHGIIGEVAARMAGNTPGSGFKATMTNELLIGEIKKVAKHDPALAQWLSAAVGGVVNKVSGESSNSGAATASYATKWNEYVVPMYGIYHAPIAEDYQLGTEEQKQIAEQYGRYIMVKSMESEADTLLPPRDWPKEENQLVVKAAGISPWSIPVTFNHAYGVDYQGNKYLIQGADIGEGTFPVHITKSTVTYKWGSFTGVSAYANIGILGGTGASISKDSFSTNSSISTTGMAVVGIETAIQMPNSNDFRYGVNEARGIDFKYYNIYQPNGLFTNPNNNNEESSEERID